jgi:hypothetical protein
MTKGSLMLDPTRSQEVGMATEQAPFPKTHIFLVGTTKEEHISFVVDQLPHHVVGPPDGFAQLTIHGKPIWVNRKYMLYVVEADAGPSAEDIQRAFGGRVFGVVGRPGQRAGWGGGPTALRHLSLEFTVQDERVEVDTSRDDPHEQTLLSGLAFRAITEPRPRLPLTLTFEERAARLRVCGREQDFKSYVCGDRAIAFTRVGDLWVTVESPTALLASQSFDLHDEAEIKTRDEAQAAQ